MYKSKKGAGYPKTLVNFEDVESLAVRAKWLYQAHIAKVRWEEEKGRKSLPFPFSYIQK